MSKEIILNKKRSIVNSIIVPLIFFMIYILIYNFIPEIKPNIDENLNLQFLKGAFILAGVITFIISLTTFWGIEFFSEKKYKKSQFVLTKKKVELLSFVIPCIIGALLILFVSLLPSYGNSKLLLINYMKISVIIAVLISVINSTIIYWITILLSLSKEKEE